MKLREESGRQAAVDGFAHEHIAAGLLMKKYQNVSLVDLPLSTFDIIIVMEDESGNENIIRAQSKTATTAVSFTGGSRGGVDREYISGVKQYRQSTRTSDVVVGVHPVDKNSFDLYFVPTILIEELNQGSISINRIRQLRENYEILENCKNANFVLEKCKQYGILKVYTQIPIPK